MCHLRRSLKCLFILNKCIIMFQPKEENPNVMLALSFSRIAFIPLFLLCNVQPRHHIPVLFDSDIAPMLIMVVFAFTNGYFGTLCMIYGPRYVS